MQMQMQMSPQRYASLRRMVNGMTKKEVDALSDSQRRDMVEFNLAQEIAQRPFIFPDATYVIIHWQGESFVGAIQHLDKTIVILTKALSPSPESYLDIVREFDEGRLELVADDALELEGKVFTLEYDEDARRVFAMDQAKWEQFQAGMTLISIEDNPPEDVEFFNIESRRARRQPSDN